jgi:hypothetical protein
MDIETLKALGVSPDELAERIVDQAVETLLSFTGYNEDGEKTGSYASRFRKEIEARVQASVDAKITALAAEHIVPKVGEMIESANMRRTNQYGEPVSAPMTLKEYIAHRAEVYMSEPVNYNGKSKNEESESYNFRVEGPRLTVLMRMYIRETLEKHAKAAVTDVNQVIAKSIQKSAVDAIAAASAALKVSVSA